MVTTEIIYSIDSLKSNNSHPHNLHFNYWRKESQQKFLGLAFFLAGLSSTYLTLHQIEDILVGEFLLFLKRNLKWVVNVDDHQLEQIFQKVWQLMSHAESFPRVIAQSKVRRPSAFFITEKETTKIKPN